VALNAVFLESGMGGLETYVRRLVPELRALRPDVRLTLFVNEEGSRSLRDEAWASEVELATHPLLGRRYTRALSETTLLGSLAAARGVDVLHSVAMTGPLWTRRAHVTTVGDLIWVRYRSPEELRTRIAWKLLVPRVAARANRVLTFSDASAADIAQTFGVPRSKIDVVPPGSGADPPPEPTPPSDLRHRLRLGDGPVVLTVSAKKPHKNLIRLVQAMQIVRERVPQSTLVVPGKPTRHEEELRRQAEAAGVKDAVRFPAYVSAADLEGLYGLADCFVFPSLQEGFGLPVLEAMRRDLPVACSSTSSLPEVAGPAARYFDPLSVVEIASAVVDLLENRALSEQLAQLGHKQQQLFTWRKAGEGTFASYERAYAEAHRP
jgi:glycosyltransferase involved in cell wall biosynthesis